MASTSGFPPTSEENGLLIDQFCSVTGLSHDVASKMLDACKWNLEMAINMQLDSDFSKKEQSVNRSVNAVDDGDTVRPPIPQSRCILVEDDLTFRYNLRSRKRGPHSACDVFRDFQGSSDENSGTSKKRRTQKDLFRPPFDLMHKGTFESARDYGQSSNRWLMVNIQNSEEFACKVLNRDVWSNLEVKRLINEHFVFWQVYSDSLIGERYIQFYQPVDFPYVAVIDPRTGEKLVVWHNVEASTISDLVDVFLKEHPSPNGTNSDDSESPSKFSLLDQSEDNQQKGALAASSKESNRSQSSVDDDECDLEYFESDSENICDTSSECSSVISDNSYVTVDLVGYSESDDESDLQYFESDSKNTSDISSESSIASSDHSCDTIDVEGYSESNSKEEDQIQENWKNYLGSEDDPKTHLALRLPDGKRDQITWPCTTKIKALFLYVGELGYDFEKYELVTNFPQKNLCHLDLLKTLKEVDLFPREMIIVQQKSLT